MNHEIGSALVAILVSIVGYVLHRKSNHIQVLVNGKLDTALLRIQHLEEALGLYPGEALPPK